MIQDNLYPSVPSFPSTGCWDAIGSITTGSSLFNNSRIQCYNNDNLLDNRTQLLALYNTWDIQASLLHLLSRRRLLIHHLLHSLHFLLFHILPQHHIARATTTFFSWSCSISSWSNSWPCGPKFIMHMMIIHLFISLLFTRSLLLNHHQKQIYHSYIYINITILIHQSILFINVLQFLAGLHTTKRKFHDTIINIW